MTIRELVELVLYADAIFVEYIQSRRIGSYGIIITDLVEYILDWLSNFDDDFEINIYHTESLKDMVKRDFGKLPKYDSRSIYMNLLNSLINRKFKGKDWKII